MKTFHELNTYLSLRFVDVQVGEKASYPKDTISRKTQELNIKEKTESLPEC